MRLLHESARRRIVLKAAIAAGTALLVLQVAVTAAWGLSSAVPLLPTWLGPEPPRLEPGTYQTRPTFVPRTTFTVGRGWYGGQGSHTDWCVGKRLNALRVRTPFGVVAICSFRLAPPYGTAVSRFKAMKTLTAGTSTPIRVGGYRGVSFHAAVQGDHALLPMAPHYVHVLPGGQQIFLSVRGRTLLLRIEIFAPKAGEAAVRRFLPTMRFPR